MWTQSVDTVFVVAPAAARSIAADWALVLLGALAALGLLVLVPLIFGLRRALKGVMARSRELETKAEPLLERARTIGANLEFITTQLKHDAESLHSGVRAVSSRMTEASEHLEERVQAFNALLEVMQQEAEDAFIDTVSTARGVREGARRLRRKADGPAEPGPRSKPQAADAGVETQTRMGRAPAE